MNKSYQAFIQQLEGTVNSHPSLSIIDENGEKFLRGTLDVVDSDGKFWESFEVEIKYKHGFPNRFPKLFEIGGKIPKILDWHIFTSDNSSCITIPPHEVLLCLNGITISWFIEYQVMPHLFNQTHRLKEGFYVNGEYEHGIDGLWQFYEEELDSTDRLLIVKLLVNIAEKNKPGKKDLCFCGSGEKYRNCHRMAFIKLSRLGKDYLLDQAKTLYESIK